MGAELGLFAFGWDDHFPGMRPTWILGERDDDSAFADLRCEPDSGIADLWGGDARTVRCRPLRDVILESSQSQPATTRQAAPECGRAHQICQ